MVSTHAIPKMLASAVVGAIAVLGLPTGASARTLAGPDLVVAAVDAPHQILSGRSFAIGVRILERNGVGASATVTASANGVVLATQAVVVDAGGSVTLSLPATLVTPGNTHVDVAVSGATPAEETLTNNTGAADVEVTEFQVVPGTAVGPPLAGYGAQFNQNVYAAISRNDGVTDDNVRWMERSVLALRPQFSRVFFNPAAFSDPDLMQSFVRTVLLAQRAGTTINVTWQGGVLDVKSCTRRIAPASPGAKALRALPPVESATLLGADPPRDHAT
jgi:hypothetical protein